MHLMLRMRECALTICPLELDVRLKSPSSLVMERSLNWAIT